MRKVEPCGVAESHDWARERMPMQSSALSVACRIDALPPSMFIDDRSQLSTSRPDEVRHLDDADRHLVAKAALQLVTQCSAFNVRDDTDRHQLDADMIRAILNDACFVDGPDRLEDRIEPSDAAAAGCDDDIILPADDRAHCL